MFAIQMEQQLNSCSRRLKAVDSSELSLGRSARSLNLWKVESMQFSDNEDFAKQLDAQDSLHVFREKFHLPANRSGEPLIYFAGNSLGLMPKAAKQIVEQELEDWAKLGVDAHLKAKTPWYSYHETLRGPAARLVGAQPIEVISMK